MGTCARHEPALVFSSVGVHAEVEIAVGMPPGEAESAWICFGRNEGLTLDFADVDSLELLAGVAGEGARLLRERIAANRAAHGVKLNNKRDSPSRPGRQGQG